MKKLFILALIISFSTNWLYSQKFQYTVKIYNNQGKVFPNVKVWFENKTTGKQIVKYTNSNGDAVFELRDTGVWTLNLIGLHDYKTVKLNERTIGNGSVTVIYDLEGILAEQEFKRKRSLSKFTYEDQSKIKIKKVPEDKAVITVFLKSNNGKYYKDVPVALVSVVDKKIYTTETDKFSKAKFLVPNNQMYAVDVDDAVNCAFTKNFGNFSASTVTLDYKPTNIVEHSKNDTITQQITPHIEATTTRAFVTLRIVNKNHDFYKNEPVYLSQINSNKVYKGITNTNGEVSFLLPSGNKYMINFDFRSNVDVINLSKYCGYTTIFKQIVYTPFFELENPDEYIPTPEDLFLTNLNSIYKPTDEGLTLSWGNENFNPNTKQAILQLDLFLNDDQHMTRPVNIAFVIDKSGSMCEANIIEALKQSMIDLVKKIPYQDEVAIITFESNAYLDAPMKPIAENSELIPIISDIEAGGGTDIYEGLTLGYSELEKHFDKDRDNILILFTDGDGSHPIDSVAELVKTYNKKGIQTVAVAVGDFYNQYFFNKISKNNNDTYKNLKDTKEITEFFANDILEILNPIGTRAKIEIFYNDNIKLTKIFETQADITSDKATVNIGKVYNGFTFSMIASFDVKNPQLAAKNNPVKVIFSYIDQNFKKVEIEKVAKLKYDNKNEEYKIVIDDNIKNNYAIVLMNDAITEMAEIFEKNPNKALTALTDCQKKIDVLAPDFNNQYIKDSYEKLDLYSASIKKFLKKVKN